MKEEIKSESEPDIGILIAGQRSSIRTHIETLSNIMTQIHKALPYSKYAFLQLPNRTRLNRFRRYENQKFANAVQSLVKHVKMSRFSEFNANSMIQQALNYLITEDRHSFSKRKCIIVFTEDWISPSMLSSIYRLYDEKVKIINVNFEEQAEKPRKVLSVNGIDISYFDAFEISNASK